MSAIAAFILSAAILQSADCRMLTSAKQAGGLVEASDTAIVPCPAAGKAKGQNVPLLWFDRKAGAIRARSAIAAGQMLGRAYFPAQPAVRPGDQISFTVSLGHVKISREVLALQPSLPGQKFFARTDDGAIIAVPSVHQDDQP